MKYKHRKNRDGKVFKKNLQGWQHFDVMKQIHGNNQTEPPAQLHKQILPG